MIVLASASPRRQELLRAAGIEFVVQPADVDETPLPGESAQQCAERLAQGKALAVSSMRPNDIVLAADTVVVVDGMILGKPVNADDAARMLRMLAGRVHDVITGVCIALPVQSIEYRVPSQVTSNNKKNESPVVRTVSEVTQVTMTDISDQEIREYVSTGEPMDKAGAYAIQGRASRWIPRIEGDYSNVVGLPVARVWRMLKDLRR